MVPEFTPFLPQYPYPLILKYLSRTFASERLRAILIYRIIITANSILLWLAGVWWRKCTSGKLDPRSYCYQPTHINEEVLGGIHYRILLNAHLVAWKCYQFYYLSNNV